eukprot:1833448-Rhodomonas_salina.1
METCESDRRRMRANKESSCPLEQRVLCTEMREKGSRSGYLGIRSLFAVGKALVLLLQRRRAVRDLPCVL